MFCVAEGDSSGRASLTVLVVPVPVPVPVAAPAPARECPAIATPPTRHAITRHLAHYPLCCRVFVDRAAERRYGAAARTRRALVQRALWLRVQPRLRRTAVQPDLIQQSAAIAAVQPRPGVQPTSLQQRSATLQSITSTAQRAARTGAEPGAARCAVRGADRPAPPARPPAPPRRRRAARQECTHLPACR